MATTPDARATTIGKYIARFRQEKPRPREQREAPTAQEDFWWTQPRNNGLRSTRTGDEMAAERRGVETQVETEAHGAQPTLQATPLEWEVELLSELSASQAGSGRVSGSAASASASASAWSSEPSPVPSRSPSASSGHSAANREAVDASLSRRVERKEVVLDDGFVVVEDALQDEEMKMLDTSLEDPEIVIQRIRRRLGFQAQQTQQQHYAIDSAESPASVALSSVYSPLRDEQLELAELLSSFGSAPASTPIDRKSTGAFTLELEDHDDVEASLPEHEVQTLYEQQSISASDRHEEKAAAEESAHEEAVDKHEDTVKEHEDERVDSVASQGSADGAVQSEEEGKAETMVEVVTEATSVAYQMPEAVTQDAPVDSPAASEDPGGTRSSSTGRKLPPSTEEKPSPRLPPLSPARGPMFRMALTPSASPSISPRLVGASAPPEVTAETSKTLDSLLSLVVHSWGEDSFFGGSDVVADALETPAEVQKEDAGDSETIKEPEPLVSHSETLEPVKPAEGASEVKEVAVEDLGSLEEIHASDPIVQMLRDRIAVFEEALVRMESKQDTEETEDVE